MENQSSKTNPLLGRGGDDNQKRWRRPLWLLFVLIPTLTYFGPRIGSFWAGRVGGEHNDRTHFEGDDIVQSDNAVVASDHGRCSEIGVSILRDGGHAVDGAVATALCLGVVNQASSGIGGGGFMVVRSSSTSQTQAFDMRETAPSASSQDMYENNPESKYLGPLSMGVPGELAGLHEAWLQHGQLPWTTLFQPAIKLAKDGFEVSYYLAKAIASTQKKILNDPGLRKIYAPNGQFLEEGDMCYNEELGRTLEEIAEQGPKAFYDGRIGDNLVKEVREMGGILSMEDLRNYRVKVTEAVVVNAMGYTILGMPSPSSGTLGLSLVLKILDSYENIDAVKGPMGLHRLIEAMKHMFALRMNLGDPDFVNITEVISDMLSPSFAKQLQQRIIDNTTFPSEYYMPKWSQVRDHGTTHFVVVDADRNVASMTSTVNYDFGGGILSPSTGIVINNQMDDFSTLTDDKLPPAPANFIQPKKRPISSMTPAIILKDDQLAGVIGASGGIHIIPAVVQVFLNHFMLGMDPLAAVQSPRVYHELIPNVVLYENLTIFDGDHIELSRERKHFLQHRGHQLESLDDGATCQLVVHTIPNAVNVGRKMGKSAENQIFRGTLTAVSDPRKNGKPAAM